MANYAVLSLPCHYFCFFLLKFSLDPAYWHEKRPRKDQKVYLGIRWSRIPRQIFPYFTTGHNPVLLFFSSLPRDKIKRFHQTSLVRYGEYFIPFKQKKFEAKIRRNDSTSIKSHINLPFHLPNTKDSDHSNFIAQIYCQQPLKSFPL